MKGINTLRMSVLIVATLLTLTTIVPIGTMSANDKSNDFYVHGNVTYAEGGVPESVSVELTNTRTGEVLYDFSHTGKYRKNLAEYPSGYRVGDLIVITAVDNNRLGELNTASEKIILPKNTNEKRVDLILVNSPKPPLSVATLSLDAPSPPEMIMNVPPPIEKGGKQPSLGEDNSKGSSEGLGPLGDTCYPPANEYDEWIISDTQECVDRVIERQNNIIIEYTGHLIFRHVDLTIHSVGDPPNNYNIKVGDSSHPGEGQFEVFNNINGPSFITRPIGLQYGYLVNTYGYLHISGSIVRRMTGTPTQGGINFYSGSTGLIESDSEISYGDTHNIYANDPESLEIKDSAIIYAGQALGISGSGIYLDDSYAVIGDNNDISNNEEAGVYVKDVGTTLKSSHGKPDYEPGMTIAYYIWWDEDGLHIAMNTDGTSIVMSGTVKVGTCGAEEATYPFNQPLPTGQGDKEVILTINPWGPCAWFDLYINGQKASTDQIFIGYSGWHPDANPFEIDKTKHVLIKNSIISANYNGIEAHNSAPSIIGNDISDHPAYAIAVADYSNANVGENTIDVPSNAYGIYLEYQGNRGNIRDNQIQGPEEGYGYSGLWAHAALPTIVKENTVKRFSFGMTFGYNTGSTITYNKVNNCSIIGIYFFLAGYSPNTLASYNVVENCSYGMDFRYSTVTATYNTVKFNTITGMSVRDPGSAIISNNWILGNNIGIYVYPHEVSGSSPLIEGNIIQRNIDYGIHTVNSAPTISNGNQIRYNGDGILVEGELGTQYPLIIGNTISSNIDKGILIDSSSSTNIQSNNIEENTDGIYSSYSSPIITSNYIANNDNYGVYIQYTIQGEKSNLIDNTIYNNAEVGVYVYQSNPEIKGSSEYTQSIYENKINVYLSYASATISKNYIYTFFTSYNPGDIVSEIGIHADYHSSYPTIIEDNFIQNHRYYGIHLSIGSSPHILGNVIRGWSILQVIYGSMGINIADECSPHIGVIGNGNDVKAGTGINSASGSAIIKGNLITESGYGIYEYISASTILGNIIRGYYVDGILSDWSSSTIIGGDDQLDKNAISSNAPSSHYGIHMRYAKVSNSGDKGAGLLNDNILGPSGFGKILQEWQVMVKVTYTSGAPVQDAAVTIFECLDPPLPCSSWEQYPPGNYYTDENGLTDWITVREYIRDNDDILNDRAIHRFHAQKETMSGDTIYEVTDNKPNPIDPEPIVVVIS